MVTWLVSVATDEGQLSLGVRIGRTLLLAPLCSGIGVALAIAGSRARGEIGALEAIGVPATRSALAAVAGASLPTILAAAVLAASSAIDVRPFYPQPPAAESFERTAPGWFESRSLGVRIDARGFIEGLKEPERLAENLPEHARLGAGLAIAFAGLAFSLAVAGASVRITPRDETTERRRRVRALAEGVLVAALTLVAFQGAAARTMSALIASVPPAALLAAGVARMTCKRP
jgi:hypothetical protein